MTAQTDKKEVKEEVVKEITTIAEAQKAGYALAGAETDKAQTEEGKEVVDIITVENRKMIKLK